MTKKSDGAKRTAPENGNASSPLHDTRVVAQVWAEVLGRGEIKDTDNFFDLGGDSLKALEVIARLQATLNVELPLIAFFEDPTIAHLAQVIDTLRSTDHENSQPRAGNVAGVGDERIQATVERVWCEVLERENI